MAEEIIKNSEAVSFEQVKEATALKSVAGWLGIPLQRRGRYWFANCPLPAHQEKTPSFCLGDERSRKFVCYGCGERGDVFDLVEAVLTLSKYEALCWLAERHGWAIRQNAPRSTSAAITVGSVATAPPPIKPEVKSEASTELDENLCDEVYRALLDELPLEGFAEAELTRRGMSRRRFFAVGYRSFPFERESRRAVAEKIAARFKLGNAERYVPGFFQLPDGGGWMFGGSRLGERTMFIEWQNRQWSLELQGLLFPATDRSGKIRYLKIRNADFNASEIGLEQTEFEKIEELENQVRRFYPPKYQVVSSAERKSGAAARLDLHVSQLHPFQSERFILTEGELKADRVADLLQFPTAAIAGVGLHHQKIFEMLLSNSPPSSESLIEHQFHEVFRAAHDCQRNLRLKTLDELYEETPDNYQICNFQQVFGNLPHHSVLLAFDRDQSQAVERSLLKFQKFTEMFGEIIRHRFYCLFWDGTRAKGFDDLLRSEYSFSFLPLARVWKKF